ncbi:hypothetical protein [Vreelandella arcis]|uniref:Tetratricopeptide repeat-containing protein n=1 Tax=Vreelandella arcis TaxID=416873 RepID=A0A1H0I3J7_9GAMM|nr:hypothetical protein [Halomonas arcis]SDO25965.1 hypothetical protein SAMN04487951_11822 [Halomonas arcis]
MLLNIHLGRLNNSAQDAFRYLLIVALIATLVVVALPAWAYQAELTNAQTALEQGDNQAAYALLKGLEFEHSGTPTFDYWLGIAALRAGEPSHALIALDRVILIQPNHAGARMERVAALLQLDQRRAAERELAKLRALSPPPDAQEAINQFQAVIKQRRLAENSPQHQGRLGVSIGYDSNPQRLPNEIAIDPLRPELRRLFDALLEIGLDPNGDLSRFDEQVLRSDASAYKQLQGSYQGIFPIDKQSRWRLSTIGQAQRYNEASAQDYDLTIARARLGYQRDLAAERSWTLSSSALQGWNGQQQNHLLTRWGLGSDFQHSLGVASQLNWQLDIEDNHFSAANNDYTTGRIGVEMITEHQAFRTRLTAQLEHEWADRRRDGGDLNQLRLGAGVDYKLTRNQLIRADISHQIRRFQEDGFALYNNFAATERRDRIWQARLGWLYQFNRDWLLKASIDAERRLSSLDIFNTRRVQTQLGLHRLF